MLGEFMLHGVLVVILVIYIITFERKSFFTHGFSSYVVFLTLLC